FASRSRHTSWSGDWSSDVCSSDLRHMMDERCRRAAAVHIALLNTMTHDALAGFHPIVQDWFTETLGEPSAPQLAGWPAIASGEEDRKSTRLNSSHQIISYAVFCLK